MTARWPEHVSTDIEAPLARERERVANPRDWPAGSRVRAIPSAPTRATQDAQDGPLHRINVGQNVGVPKAQHLPAMALEPSGSALVVGASGVLTAVGLDHKAVFNTGKIDHERPQRMLTAKFVSSQPLSTQRRPQPAFGICHCRPQAECRAVGHRRQDSTSVNHPHLPGPEGPGPSLSRSRGRGAVPE